MKRKRTNSASRAEQAQRRAASAIGMAGWNIIRVREGGVGLFVARKTIREEDDSATHLFESTYTLEGLAKQVDRRQREEGLS